jgi:hypothetical protein
MVASPLLIVSYGQVEMPFYVTTLSQLHVEVTVQGLHTAQAGPGVIIGAVSGSAALFCVAILLFRYLGRQNGTFSTDPRNWSESGSGVQSGQLGRGEAEVAGVNASVDEVDDESSGNSVLPSNVWLSLDVQQCKGDRWSGDEPSTGPEVEA